MLGRVSKIIPLVTLWSGVILAIFNSFTFSSPPLGVMALFGVLWGASSLIGPIFLNQQTRAVQTSVGFIVIIALFAILGSAVYYTMPVTKISLSLILLIVASSASLLGKHNQVMELKRQHFINLHPIVTTAIIGSILALSAWFFAVIQVTVVNAVRTPWDVISPIIILALSFCLVFIFGLLHQERATKIALPIFVLTFFAAISLTSLIYPYGFGFDPFIHRATISHIAEFGSITPKPLYYIGQYSLELFSTQIFSLPLNVVDRFLLPILASLIITMSAAIGFSLTFKERKLVPLVVLFFLPLSAFILTTPQSLAYVFTAALLFLSLPRLIGKTNTIPYSLLFILTLAALITHPLAGIPAAIYFLMLLISTSEFGYPIIKQSSLIIIALLGSISLPIVFAVQAKMSGLAIIFNPSGAFDLSRLNLSWFFANHFSSVYDGLYLVIDNMLWIVLVLMVVGIIFSYKNNAKSAFYLPAIASVMWLINYWLLASTLEFEFLIEYERANYADRLITLAMIFAIPMIAVAFSGIHKLLLEKPRILHISFVLLLTFIISANIYGAYPRHDNYARSSGFNVADSDFNAVLAIEQAGGDEDFIVLANQAVSAAALQTFGFKKYYKGDIFYYPIPTGGKLYTKYLEMTNEGPLRTTALEAMDIVKVDTMFLVVNDYWWQADKIIENAKLEADDWFALDDGAVTVFEYRRF